MGVNGAGKTTLMRLATGELEPTFGTVRILESAVYCPQRTDATTALERDFVHGEDPAARRWQGQLEVQEEWIDRWSSLSHGERKRIQIGAALWYDPAVLAVDEPTNHLDSVTRKIVGAALSAYRGVGMLVSHDRDLLDNLCRRCAFVNPPNVDVRQGSYTFSVQQRGLEQENLRKEYRKEKQNISRLKAEAARRRSLAAAQQSRRSKRGIPIHDHDARFKKNLARVSGRDGVGGKLLRQMDGSIRHAEKRVDAVMPEKTYDSGIWVSGEITKRDSLFQSEKKVIQLGGSKQLELPELVIRPDSRVGIEGPNGSGKSTLISFIKKSLQIDQDRIVYIPQEIEQKIGDSLIAQTKLLDSAALGRLMAVVSRLGSRPERLLESKSPSPGEVRKLLLALGITRRPHIIIMDEPSNHMDLPSIECLESALSDAPCCLLLVSHDLRFLFSLTAISWQVRKIAEKKYQLSVQRR